MVGQVRRTGIGAIGLGLVALVALMGATDVAFAKKKHKVLLPVRGPLVTVAAEASIVSSPASPLAQRSGTADCPAGTTLVGGGYDQGEIDPAATTPGGLTPDSSHRDGLSSWRVDVFGLAAAARPVTVFAYCRSNVEPLTQVVLDGTVGPNVPGTLGTETTLTVPCPQGQRAVTGGWGSMAVGFLHVTGSARSAAGDAWQLTVSNFVPSQLQIPVYAYCTPNAVLTTPGSELAIPKQTSAGLREPVRSTGGTCPAVWLPAVKKRLGKKSKKQRRKLRKNKGRAAPMVPVGGGFTTRPGTYAGLSFSVNEMLDASLGPDGWTVDLGHGGIESAVTTQTYCMR